jgi:hypothetical protein
MHRLRSSIALVPAAVAAVACGCGSGSAAPSTVAPATWHASVCKAVATFGKAADPAYMTLKGLSLQFQYGLPKQSETRDKEVRVTTSLADASTRFRESVEAAGIPRVDQGRPYDEAIVAALRDFESDMGNLRDRARALPQGDGRASSDALLTPDFEAALKRLGSRLDAARARYGVAQDPCPSAS